MPRQMGQALARPNWSASRKTEIATNPMRGSWIMW